jgi:hypothetical protein
MKFPVRLTTFSLFLLLANCVGTPDDPTVVDAEQALDDEDVGEVSQALCDAFNLDSTSTCRSLNGVSQCNQDIMGYHGEYGWTQWWWPSTTQVYCNLPYDNLRLYWDQPWVKAPANRETIRLRYQGPNACCKQGPYRADYLKAADGTNYLRVQLSSNPGGTCPCNAADYVMVAP